MKCSEHEIYSFPTLFYKIIILGFQKRFEISHNFYKIFLSILSFEIFVILWYNIIEVKWSGGNGDV